MKTGIRAFLACVLIEAFFLQHFYSLSPNGFEWSSHLFTWGIFLFLTSLSFFFGIERRHNISMQGLEDHTSIRQNINAFITQFFGLSESLSSCYPIGFATLLASVLNLIFYFILL